jgi:hypothetical protein
MIVQIVMRSTIEVTSDLKRPADSTIRSLTFVIKDASGSILEPQSHWFAPNGTSGYKVSSNWQASASSKKGSSKKKYKPVDIGDLALPDIKLPRTCGVEDYELEVMLSGMKVPFIAVVTVNVLPSDNRSWKIVKSPRFSMQTVAGPHQHNDEDADPAVPLQGSIMIGSAKDFHENIFGVALFDEFGNMVNMDSSIDAPAVRLVYEYPSAAKSKDGSDKADGSNPDNNTLKRRHIDNDGSDGLGSSEADAVGEGMLGEKEAESEAEIEYPLVVHSTAVTSSKSRKRPLARETLLPVALGELPNHSHEQTSTIFKFLTSFRLEPECLPCNFRLIVELNDHYGGDTLRFRASRGYPTQMLIQIPSLQVDQPTAALPELTLRAYQSITDASFLFVDECGFHAKMPDFTNSTATKTASSTASASDDGSGSVRCTLVGPAGNVITATSVKGRALQSNVVTMKPFSISLEDLLGSSSSSASKSKRTRVESAASDAARQPLQPLIPHKYLFTAKYTYNEEVVEMHNAVNIMLVPVNNVIDLSVEKIKVHPDDDIWLENSGDWTKVTSGTHFPTLKLKLLTSDGSAYIPADYQESIKLKIRVEEFGKGDLSTQGGTIPAISTSSGPTSSSSLLLEEDQFFTREVSSDGITFISNKEQPRHRGCYIVNSRGTAQQSPVVYGTYYFKFLFKETRGEIVNIPSLKDKRKLEKTVSLELLPPVGEYICPLSAGSSPDHVDNVLANKCVSLATGSNSKSLQLIGNDIMVVALCDKKALETPSETTISDGSSSSGGFEASQIQLHQSSAADVVDDNLMATTMTLKAVGNPGLAFRGLFPSNCEVICRLAPSTEGNESTDEPIEKYDFAVNYEELQRLGFPELENSSLIRCKRLYAQDSHQSRETMTISALRGEMSYDKSCVMFPKIAVKLPSKKRPQQQQQFEGNSVQLILEVVEIEEDNESGSSNSAVMTGQHEQSIQPFIVSVAVTTDNALASINQQIQALENEMKEFEVEQGRLRKFKKECERRTLELLRNARTAELGYGP